MFSDPQQSVSLVFRLIVDGPLTPRSLSVSLLFRRVAVNPSTVYTNGRTETLPKYPRLSTFVKFG